MITQAMDTHPQAEAVQIALLQQATVGKRVAIMRSLSCTTIELSRRAIQRANPDFSSLDTNLAFIACHYSVELAEKVRCYLEARHDSAF